MGRLEDSKFAGIKVKQSKEWSPYSSLLIIAHLINTVTSDKGREVFAVMTFKLYSLKASYFKIKCFLVGRNAFAMNLKKDLIFKETLPSMSEV